MKESIAEAYIFKHLTERGWKVTTDPKLPGHHGVDIEAYHPKWRKRVLIEVKGGSGKNKHQEIHNSFYNVIGQLLARMDIEGNHNNRARIYAIGIPLSWCGVYKKKIMRMKYGWSLLKPKVYLVKSNGKVFEKTYSFFLKK